MSNLVEASARAGARLVVLDNVYMLGKPNGNPLGDDSPMNPCSRKGEIRARVARLLFDAHRRGDVRAVCGRASDFYGPGGTLTQLGDYFWPRILKGQSAQVFERSLLDVHAHEREVALGASRRTSSEQLTAVFPNIGKVGAPTLGFMG